jgi:hypothetical protein
MAKTGDFHGHQRGHQLAKTGDFSVATDRARPTRHGFQLSRSVGRSLTSIGRARRVVVEVDESGPELDTPELP